MKGVLEALILKYLLVLTLASPKDRILKVPDFSSEAKIEDYDIKDVLQKTKDEFDRRSVQEHTLKENDRRRDYARYYFNKPSKGNEYYNENDSSEMTDLSGENLESLESELNDDKSYSEKNERGHKKSKNTSSYSSDESKSDSRERNFDGKKKSRNSSEQSKETIDDSDDFDSIDDYSSEISLEKFRLSLEKNETQKMRSKLVKKENSKIKSLIKKLNKSLHNKQVLNVKDLHEVNIEKMIQESTITKWREVEIVVRLLVIDNYRYTKEVLFKEMINNTQVSQQQISRLERNLLQEYYLSKKDISRTVKLARKKFKIDVSELSEKKTHDVEKLYISQLKDQINGKIFAFKQNIKSAIDQFQLELRSTSGSVAQHLKTTAIQNEISIQKPSDSIYRNEPVIDGESNLPSYVSIIFAEHITTEEIPKSSWNKNSENNYDSEDSAVSYSGFHKNSNKINTSSGTQSSKSTQNSSSQGEADSYANGILNKGNGLTDSPTGAETTSFKINDLSNSVISSKITNNAISTSGIFPEPVQEGDVNKLHADTLVKNKQDTRYFTQEHSAYLLPSNIVKTNEKDNDIDNNFNLDTESIQQMPSSTHNNELVKSISQPPTSVHSYVAQHPRVSADIESEKSKTSFQSSERKVENGIHQLNIKTAVEGSEYNKSPIDHITVTDHTNLLHENSTSQVNKIPTVIESEINVNLPMSSVSSALNDDKLNPPNSLDNFSSLDNQKTQIINLTTENNLESSTNDSDSYNRANQMDPAKTSITNNKSVESLSDINNRNHSLSIDQPMEVVQEDNIIKDNQINSSNQHNITDEQLVSNNETDYPHEEKQGFNVKIRKTETVEPTNTDIESQYVHNPISTETTTNSGMATRLTDYSNDKNNTDVLQNNEISNSGIVNDAKDSNYSQKQQSIDISENFTVIKKNDEEPGQQSINNHKIKILNQSPATEDVTINNNQSEHTNNYLNPSEANTILTQSAIPVVNNYASNRTSENFNEVDPAEFEPTYNVTNENRALNNNESIKNIDSQHRLNDNENASTNYYSTESSTDSTTEFSDTEQYPNEIYPTTFTYNLESSGNIDVQNQKHTKITDATGNVKNEHQSVEPIDGNIENLSGQINFDVIPHDVNVGNVRNTNDVNEVPRIISIKSDAIDITNDYGIDNVTGDESQIGNSYTTPIPQKNVELQNVKETTTDNYLYNEHENTEAMIDSYSANKTSDYLLSDHSDKSILSENEKVNSTDIPVPDTILDKNTTNELSVSSTLAQHLDKNHSRNGTAKDSDHIIDKQFEKTTQINLFENDKHSETTTPHSTAIIQEPLNEIIFNDSAKIIPNETSTIDSTSYDNDEIATNLTKNSGSSLFIDAPSSSATTTDTDFYTEPQIEETTENDSKLINSSTSTLRTSTELPQSTSSPTATNGIGITDITTEETNISTTIMTEIKINTSECTDPTGVIIDCESLILSSSGNIEKANNIENEKSTTNVWPGIPQECLPLFIASDGTVLKEIPSVVNIPDAQTRNLCVSIAITIIQLNSSPPSP